MMKHYENPETGELFGFEADGSQDAFIPPHLVPVTDARADEIRTAALAGGGVGGGATDGAMVQLNPAQWDYFLDLTGFRAVLDTALDALPKGTLAERAEWAKMRAVAYRSTGFRLDVTLQLSARVRQMGLPLSIPTDDEITAGFADAAMFKGAESLLGGGQ